MELRKLLLESLHPALEMYLEPFAGMDREEPHPLGYIAPFVDATNDIGKGLVYAFRKIILGTSGTIVVRQIAGTETEFAYLVGKSGLLERIGSLPLKHDRLDDPFDIFRPKLWTLLLCLAEGNLFGHANDLHVLQFDYFMFHTDYTIINESMCVNCLQGQR